MMLNLYDALQRRNPGWAISLVLVGGWLSGVALLVLAVVAVRATGRLVH